jgi:hypothetical protein
MKYRLTISNPIIIAVPPVQASGIIFRGILTTDETIVGGYKTILSVKDLDGIERLQPLGTDGSDNKLVFVTLKPTGGDPSGFTILIPDKSQAFLIEHFNDDNPRINIWDNYNNIAMETTNAQYYITYELIPIKSSFDIITLILFMIIVLLFWVVISPAYFSEFFGINSQVLRN